MGGDPLAGQEARLGEYERAGADGREPPGLAGVLADPGDEVRGGVPCPVTARQQQEVEALPARQLAQGAVGRQAQAA